MRCTQLFSCGLIEKDSHSGVLGIAGYALSFQDEKVTKERAWKLGWGGGGGRDGINCSIRAFLLTKICICLYFHSIPVLVQLVSIRVIDVRLLLKFSIS